MLKDDESDKRMHLKLLDRETHFNAQEWMSENGEGAKE